MMTTSENHVCIYAFSYIFMSFNTNLTLYILIILKICLLYVFQAIACGTLFAWSSLLPPFFYLPPLPHVMTRSGEDLFLPLLWVPLVPYSKLY